MKKFSLCSCACLLLAVCFILSGCVNATIGSNEASTSEITSSAGAGTAGDVVENRETEALTNESAVPKIICANERYTITEINGKCYINFTSGNDATPEESAACQVGEISFSSVEDMRQRFLENTLSDSEALVLRAAFSDCADGIELCSLTNLYQAQYPDGMEVEKVSLSDMNYYFRMKENETCGYASVGVASQELYQSTYRLYYRSFEANAALVNVTRQDNDEFDGVPCEIVEYEITSYGGLYRDVFFDIAQDDVTMQVVLSYAIENTEDALGIPPSDTIPWQAYMFGEVDGQYFIVHINKFLSAPTLSWLASFGIEPHAGNSNQVTE